MYFQKIKSEINYNIWIHSLWTSMILILFNIEALVSILIPLSVSTMTSRCLGGGYSRGWCVWSTWSGRCRATARGREGPPPRAAWEEAGSDRSPPCPHPPCSSDRSAPELEEQELNTGLLPFHLEIHRLQSTALLPFYFSLVNFKLNANIHIISMYLIWYSSNEQNIHVVDLHMISPLML